MSLYSVHYRSKLYVSISPNARQFRQGVEFPNTPCPKNQEKTDNEQLELGGQTGGATADELNANNYPGKSFDYMFCSKPVFAYINDNNEFGELIENLNLMKSKLALISLSLLIIYFLFNFFLQKRRFI